MTSRICCHHGGSLRFDATTSSFSINFELLDHFNITKLCFIRSKISCEYREIVRLMIGSGLLYQNGSFARNKMADLARFGG